MICKRPVIPIPNTRKIAKGQDNSSESYLKAVQLSREAETGPEKDGRVSKPAASSGDSGTSAISTTTWCCQRPFFPTS